MVFSYDTRIHSFFEKNVGKVFILRGIPGCGKSTFVENLRKMDALTPVDVCSADNFLIDEYGVYRYGKTLSQEAHRRCLHSFVNLVSDYRKKLMEVFASWTPKCTIVVDNTNTSVLELIPYYKVAESFGIPVVVVEFMCDPVISYNRCIHNVPFEVIMNMHQNILTERFPAFINRIIVQPKHST